MDEPAAPQNVKLDYLNPGLDSLIDPGADLRHDRPMNHNPPPVALLPPPVKPKELGPYVARIRPPGREEIRSRGLPDSDAALAWAYGYMALRAGSNDPSLPVYPNGTTVHIGAAIYVLHNRALRPIGLRRVLAVKKPAKVVP